MTGTIATVSLSALRHNAALVRKRVSPAFLLAVVKDDAYGHGVDTVTEFLWNEGVTRFGTLDLDAALHLKSRLPDAMVFAWVFDQHDDFSAAIEARIDVGITDRANLERVALAARSEPQRPARVHLKLDSGLHRAGELPAEWEPFVARAAEFQREGLLTVEGLWTHLAEASDEDDSRSISEFEHAVKRAEAYGIRGVTRHVAASAASYFRSDARFDMVRVGAFLYGIAPGSGVGPADLGLQPVMALTTPVVSVSEEGTRSFAVAGIGGAAGILSDVAGNATVGIAGRPHPIVGLNAVSMTVETTGTSVNPGDTVTVFGSGHSGEPTLQELADSVGTIGEELVTRLSASVPRIIVD